MLLVRMSFTDFYSFGTCASAVFRVNSGWRVPDFPLSQVLVVTAAASGGLPSDPHTEHHIFILYCCAWCVCAHLAYSFLARTLC
jgi:hypothetical protein